MQRKPGESFSDYMARIDAYMKRLGTTQAQKAKLKSLADNIMKEASKKSD